MIRRSFMPIKYKWLADCLQEFIKSNQKKGIVRLPTENELSIKYHVSRQTVRQALSLLESKGLIRKKQGSGSYATGLSCDPSKNIIGILLPTLTEYIYPDLLYVLQKSLESYGYSTIIFETNNSTYKERELLTQLLIQQPKGVIVEGCKTALPNPNLDLYQKLIKKGTHILFLHNYYKELTSCTYVKDNNLQGCRLLIQNLITQGHDNIGGIFHAEDMQGFERYQGFQESMRSFGCPVPDERIAWVRTSEIEELRLKRNPTILKKIVQNSLESCTAVLCYNDEIAYWLMKALQEELSSTTNLAIACFEHSYLSSNRLITASLSHKPHEMGNTAAKTMNDLCSGLIVPSKEISWELIQTRFAKKQLF